jgi:branched-chain amino acid transport system permease protein
MAYEISAKPAVVGRFKPRSDAVFVAGIIVLIGLPIFIRDPYILNFLIISLIYAVLTVSWNFICGYGGIFTFGHQAFFGLGAYFSALLAINGGLSPWWGLLLGGLAAAIVSCLIGLPCLRLRAAPYVAIMTLAFAEITRITSMNLVKLTRGEMGLWGIPNFPDLNLPGIGLISFATERIPNYYLILFIFIVTMLVLYFALGSHVGLAIRSIRDSQDAAETLGVNITYYKLLAFVGSAFFAGVAGSFYAHYLLILTPTSVFSVGMMIEILAICLIGGLGTFLGPAIVAFGLTIILEYLRFMGDYRFIVYGIILILMIMFMPEGLSKRFLRDPELSD